MPVAESPLAAAQEFYFLAVFRHLAKKIACLRIEDSGAYGHFDYLVLTVFSRGAVLAAALSVGRKHMPPVAEGEKCPHVAVAFQDDMSAASSVTSVRSPFRNILRSVEMARACATLAAAAKDLNVIYEV